MRTLPLLAILLGLAGLLPFVATGIAAMGAWNDTEVQRIGTLGLAAYGAVILSFLGAVHWGLALTGGAGQGARVQRARFGLGVVPALVGFLALLVTFVGLPKTALCLLVAGFVLTTLAEARGARNGLVPPAYMGLRWVLTLAVVIILVSVVVVLALGGRLVL